MLYSEVRLKKISITISYLVFWHMTKIVDNFNKSRIYGCAITWWFITGINKIWSYYNLYYRRQREFWSLIPFFPGGGRSIRIVAWLPIRITLPLLKIYHFFNENKSWSSCKISRIWTYFNSLIIEDYPQSVDWTNFIDNINI